MAHLTIDDDKQCYDLDTNFGRYQYLCKRLTKYGAGSDELSILEKLYKEAEVSPDLIDELYRLRERVNDDTLPEPRTGEFNSFLLSNALRGLTSEQRHNLTISLIERDEKLQEAIEMVKKALEYQQFSL